MSIQQKFLIGLIASILSVISSFYAAELIPDTHYFLLSVAFGIVVGLIVAVVMVSLTKRMKNANYWFDDEKYVEIPVWLHRLYMLGILAVMTYVGYSLLSDADTKLDFHLIGLVVGYFLGSFFLKSEKQNERTR